MPIVFRDIRGYKVYFFLDESTPLEPVHVHVSKQIHKDATKFWVLSDGRCELDHNKDRIPSHELKDIKAFIEAYHDEVLAKWIARFGEIRFRDNQD